ncbi:MAG: nucleoside triphosphate pyrophosphatase [Candidatus Babeliales bacterium]
MKKILLLGSSSSSRQKLLMQAQIPFHVVDQSYNESLADRTKPFLQLVEAIAVQKMAHVTMPPAQKEGEHAFVLTADTMGQDSKGVVHGKPMTKQEAIASIKALNGTGVVATAFCLEKKVWRTGAWHTEKSIVRTVSALYEFDMPDAWIEKYVTAVPQYKDMSGGITIEGFGAQFLKTIQGSYSTIIGLPLFELREALEELGFFN